MANAFMNCSALTSVTINSDFDNCTSFVTMFSNCTSLTDVTINGDFGNCNDVSSMFAGCTPLTNVTFNSDFSNTHIFYNMFYNCSSLVSVTNLKDGNIKPISNGTNQSFKQMFMNCSSLTDISILNGVDMTECGSVTNMFSGCTSLSNQALIDVIKTWTFSETSPILTSATNDGAANMGKTGFPAGWYECANGRVYIESGGKFRKNSFEPNQ